MRRLFHRIYFSLLVVTLLAVGLTAAIAHHVLLERGRGPYADRLSAEAALIAARLPASPAAPSEVAPILGRAAGDLRLDLALISADGRVVAAVGADLTPFHGWRSEHQWLLTRVGAVFSHPLGDGRRLVLHPRPDAESRLGFVWVVVILCVALALLCHPVARGLTRRLESLEQGVERLGAGDLEARVAVHGGDEVARLATRFNWAADRIAQLLTKERRILASASHELRSPLARLRLALELMREEGGELVARRVDEAAREVGELDELVEDVLLASRLQAGARGSIEEVDVGALAEAEARRAGASCVAARAVVVGDGRALRRLVRNLVENARRHGGGTAIEVGVERLPAEGTYGGARLWVADRGPGVPEQERERIFEPFYRRAAERPGEGGGVGLGLALVRQIAEAHGGSAGCRAREGGGTVFEATVLSAAEG